MEWLRRPLYFVLVLLTTLAGAGLMLSILGSTRFRLMGLLILPLFVITFGWIALSFWNAAIGFLLNLLRLDPLTLRRRDRAAGPGGAIHTRTAIVMPVCNEDTTRVIAGFEATLRSLIDASALRHFDFYLLSDSHQPSIIEAELAHWHGLLARLDPASRRQVFYRRRPRNTGRKVGNIADFCQRWGQHYAFMITLDADSVMSADCMLHLVRRLQASPRAALIQTVPIPVRQTTFFGRFLQFGATLYSPMLATGQSFWQTDCANYWGHNAIIRISAFMDHCGMPALPGKPPLGGEILSHDFVEAALLRRAGWQCFLLPELGGSYEEVPGNLLGYAKRDRRWVQGNLQHAMLLKSPGLHPLNRLHLLLGILAYGASALWLLMLLLSTIDASALALGADRYFPQTYQLFPEWPIARPGLILALIGITAALLLAPKVMGVILALIQQRQAFGGGMRILLGATVEMLFAILIAPLMMVFHAGFVVSVLLGRQVGWDTQAREGRLLPWRDVLIHTRLATIAALAWGGFTYFVTPILFWWLTPILAGLVLAAPLVRYSSSVSAGRLARRLGIFITPNEWREDPLLAALRRTPAVARPPPTATATPQPPALPTERPRAMPLQPL